MADTIAVEGRGALDADARSLLIARLDEAVRRARGSGRETLAAVTVAAAPSTDPSAVAFASRRPDEPCFCFEQPERDRVALATLGSVRSLEAHGPDRFERVAAAWRALTAPGPARF